MNTTQLIGLLQEADPVGDMECLVEGNHFILDAYVVPADAEGYAQVIHSHPDNPYKIQQITISGIGKKLIIAHSTMEEALMDDPSISVAYQGVDAKRMKLFMKTEVESRKQARFTKETSKHTGAD